MLKFKDGRVRVTLKDPINVYGGTPMRGGMLCYQVADPHTWHGGYPYTEKQHLASKLTGTTVPGGEAGGGGGALRITDAEGRVADTEPITHYWCGLPFVADGRLAVEPEGLLDDPNV